MTVNEVIKMTIGTEIIVCEKGMLHYYENKTEAIVHVDMELKRENIENMFVYNNVLVLVVYKDFEIESLLKGIDLIIDWNRK